ncbi:hypothetical protein HD553DRAFT_335752 [Filobasidium floriforme]|uniref:uncharacterized protein n=1 Tax=Filobasidium floriforme TaxID=5210 RepID=UPI001E8E62B7|nr:uncharacterized protein HD553DRAFT_335752 [Filobasidium floriforme]KAH8083660.1 hypothetical protein HD553DRAFT_335752 [Filobasidium floriforme]
MGSSSSKGARRLPRELSKQAEQRASAPSSAAQAPNRFADASRATTGNVEYSASRTTGPGTEHGRGRQNVYASEEMDDSIKEDGGDPDFLKNLSRLGQVAVPKPGTPFEKQAPALRTLMSRTATSTSSAAPPQNHLSAASLSNLLDRLKSLPANESSTPSQAELSLYRDYAVDPETMSTLRRWVNSPSIDPEKTKIILSEQGEESVEMTAVWVSSSATEAQKVIPPGQKTS